VDIMTQKQGDAEDVEDFIDRLLVMGKNYGMTNEQVLPAIMACIDPVLQPVMLQQNQEIEDITQLRAAASFAQACVPKTPQRVNDMVAVQQCYPRQPDNTRRNSPRQGVSPRRSQNYRNSSPFSSNATHQKRVTFQGRTCKFCGGDYHKQLSLCPARGKQCKKCSKLNHFARVCMSRSQQHTQ